MPLQTYYLVLLVMWRRTYIDCERALYHRKGDVRFIVRRRSQKRVDFQRNHRERVVDHTDDRVEFSRNTLFSLPVLLVLNDNSDHDHVPLSIPLVCPPMLWMHLLWFLRPLDPYRMIVADALQRRPTIITTLSDSYPSPQPVVPFSFLSPYGQTMDLEPPSMGLHRTP